MPEAGESELLFFDTFSHAENTEELNLDLVQFPRPVLIHEVRVVPLGTRVQADVPGGTRLGATNPASFKLDLFVNNLTKPNAATFEKLGVLEYKGNENIQLTIDIAVPTDGLIIKGWYSMITLAIYGCPTTVTKDRASPPPPPPPRSKTHGDGLMIIPPAVVDNAQTASQPSPSTNSNNAKAQDWETTAKPTVPPVEHNFPTGGSTPAAANAPSNPPSGQATQPSSTDLYHDIDERFPPSNTQVSNPPPSSEMSQKTSSSTSQEKPASKEVPQVELDEHGEPKFPKGEYESDELFEAYLREKDRRREEKERVRAERERERADQYRQESRSRTPEMRGHSRGHTRSSSRGRSRSRSSDRDYRRSSRDREYRDGSARDSYRDHRDSDWEYRERYGRERDDSRDRRESRERDKDLTKDKHDSREREHKRQSSQERHVSKERNRERDSRRDSSERSRDKSAERTKSPKSRTPRRSRSRSPPSRRSRSRSRDRNYDRDRGRDYREKDREREKDYDKNRDRDKDRDVLRERDKDYRSDKEKDYERDYRSDKEKDFDRDYRSDRLRDTRDRDDRERNRDFDSRDRERDKDRDREGWGRGDNRRGPIEGERPWDKSRESHEMRDPQQTLPVNEWDRSREMPHQQPPPHVIPIREQPIPVQEQTAHDQRHWGNPPMNEPIPPQHWNRNTPPPIETHNPVPVWGQENYVQDNWGRDSSRRVDELPGTWGPPPQASQQQPNPFPVMPEEPLPPSNVVVLPMAEDVNLMDHGYEGVPGNATPGMEGDEMYTPLSDGEIEEEPAYSDISSDENFLDNLNDEEYQQRLAELQSMDDIEDPWSYAISSFNPYQCELSPLETFDNPAYSEFELEKHNLLDAKKPEMPADSVAIQSALNKFKQLPHHEEWVEAMENVTSKLPTGLPYLSYKTEDEDTITALVDAALEGLDLNAAMHQPVTAYKLRHLKMGIRLAGALSACGSKVALKLLQSNVQHRLMDLFESQYMSPSIKLHIIKSLDNTTKHKDGLDWFLGGHSLQNSESKQSEKQTTSQSVVTIQPENTRFKSEHTDMSPYKRLVKIMLNKQLCRTMEALTSLIRKIHLYELLHKLSAIVEVLAENTTFPEQSSATTANTTSQQGQQDSEVDMDTDSLEPEVPNIPDNMTAEDIESLISCLQEVTKVVLNVDYIMGQPPKIHPNKTVFERREKPSEASQSMYHMFSSKQLLEGIFVLLSSPATFHHNGVFNAIKDLLTCMISTQKGLLYMCSRHETVNGIIRALTQTTDFTEDDEESGPRGPHPAHLLGLQLIYYLQTVQNIDRLREYHAKSDVEKEIDDADPLGMLHCLYMMTFTPQGRDAVVHVFTMDDNMGALIPFIDLPGDELIDVKIKRSVCHSYTVLLLLLIVRHSCDVRYLEKYSHQLLSFTQHEPASKTFDKVTELQDWLAPLKKVSAFVYEPAVIVELVKMLKQYSEEVTDLPKGLVTTLRILKQLGIAPERPVPGYEENEGPLEMKYNYALIEIFSADAMPLFTTIIQKIGDMLTRPLQQTLPKMGMPRMVILNTVTPVMSLVKHILQRLVAVRGKDFTDLTMLSCVFQLHTVLCSVSHTGTLSPEIQFIQNNIVDILMTYTQPTVSVQQQNEEALAKSLWTMMFKELLTYVLTAPYTFLSGLILTSELLPLPLPIQTKEPMTEEEVSIAVNQRKLWSAHLHPLSDQIQAILRNLSGSACQPLQQLLRRVCWQLADLAGPSALIVVRCLLETVTESMDASIEKHMTDAIRALPPDSRPLVEIRSSGETAKILNLLAFLMNQPPVKVAFIHLSSGKSKLTGDERHGTVLLRLARLLNVIEPECPSHMQAQESIVSIFQSLCDLEVTMIPPDNTMAFTDQGLANSLPPRDQMAIVCEALLLHIDQRDHNFSSILPALRTLALLMLHDFGFYHVKIALEKVPRAFFNLFLQINNTFSKDSSDCIATLSSAIELLQFLVALPEAPEGEEQTVPFERTYLISYKDLREVLKWNKDPAAGHPLSDLDNLLHEYAKEEETLKAVYESVNLVVSILKSDEDQSKPDMDEPTLPDPEGIVAQFNMRSIYLIAVDEDDRLSAAYWLATPLGEDTDDKDETTAMDFEELSRKYCQDFNLVEEVEKGAVQSDPPIIKRRKSRIGRRLDTINTSKMRGSSSKFVAPMRGRGFGRVMPINKNDMFRSRPQNTSRPPSMHVDDFIKMELQGGGTPPQIGPTGMNPHLTKFREQQVSSDFRGRGSFSHRPRGRGSSRGRFFNQPTSSYQSRERSSPSTAWSGSSMASNGSGMSGFGGPSPSRGMYRGRGSATGGVTGRGSPPKAPPPSWTSRPPRQDFNQVYYRVSSSQAEWGGQRSDRGGHGFTRGGGGGGGWGGSSSSVGSWRGKDERRFMPPPGTPPFYPRRDARPHQRSFTK